MKSFFKDLKTSTISKDVQERLSIQKIIKETSRYVAPTEKGLKNCENTSLGKRWQEKLILLRKKRKILTSFFKISKIFKMYKLSWRSLNKHQAIRKKWRAVKKLLKNSSFLLSPEIDFCWSVVNNQEVSAENRGYLVRHRLYQRLRTLFHL